MLNDQDYLHIYPQNSARGITYKIMLVGITHKILLVDIIYGLMLPTNSKFVGKLPPLTLPTIFCCYLQIFAVCNNVSFSDL